MKPKRPGYYEYYDYDVTIAWVFENKGCLEFMTPRMSGSSYVDETRDWNWGEGVKMPNRDRLIVDYYVGRLWVKFKDAVLWAKGKVPDDNLISKIEQSIKSVMSDEVLNGNMMYYPNVDVIQWDATDCSMDLRFAGLLLENYVYRFITEECKVKVMNGEFDAKI